MSPSRTPWGQSPHPERTRAETAEIWVKLVENRAGETGSAVKTLPKPSAILVGNPCNISAERSGHIVEAVEKVEGI